MPTGNSKTSKDTATAKPSTKRGAAKSKTKTAAAKATSARSQTPAAKTKSRAATAKKSTAKSKVGIAGKGRPTPSSAAGKNLVIVESPAKAKTINRYLGRNYVVVASNGHVIDLPKSRMAVDVEKDFQPEYITVRGRGPILEQLRKLSQKAKEVLLASDDDREGEAISFHIANEIRRTRPDAKIGRIVFSEITKQAILEAIKQPADINMKKVNAQKARRILDRLWGYQLSPFLWMKLKKRGLSGGRVQSVALRMICDREQEILKFVPEEYWTSKAEFESQGAILTMNVTKFDGEKYRPTSEAETREAEKALRNAPHTVSKVKTTRRRRKPPAPFTTSKMQQAASNRLNFQSAKTMQIAQGLYEGVDLGKERVGLITYMRTDSTRISDTALTDARDFLKANYDAAYLPDSPNQYKNKKGSQDAHECVRPTSAARTPDSVKEFLDRDQLKLYTLIWSRFVASQMTEAQFDVHSIEVTNDRGLFRASASKLVFDGWLALDKDEDDDEENTASKLPDLKEGAEMALKSLESEQHFTEPPARFSDASIVKVLEESGIGRPSTYAAIINTLLKRYYVQRKQRQLVPTELGVITNKMISTNFPDLVNSSFTATMEEKLDLVEEEGSDWVGVVRDFYHPFKQSLDVAIETAETIEGVMEEDTDYNCEKCGRMMIKRLGRNGFFLACSGFPDCKNAKPIPLGKCPTCKIGQIVEKRGGKGKRTFYGCNRYPDCEFRNWDKPIEEPCPKCGCILVVKKERGEVARKTCLNEDCGWSQSVNEAEEAKQSA